MPRLNEPSWKEKLAVGGVSDNAAEMREGGMHTGLRSVPLMYKHVLC